MQVSVRVIVVCEWGDLESSCTVSALVYHLTNVHIRTHMFFIGSKLGNCSVVICLLHHNQMSKAVWRIGVCVCVIISAYISLSFPGYIHLCDASKGGKSISVN